MKLNRLLTDQDAIPDIGAKAFFTIFYGYSLVWALLHLCIACMADIAYGGDAPVRIIVLQYAIACVTGIITLRLMIRRMIRFADEAERN